MHLIEKGFINSLDYMGDLYSMATKEFSLEKQLEGMILEWEKIGLELIPYR